MAKERICPVCGRRYHDHPALSRKDNKTNICPDCGIAEAIQEANKHICIFEKRFCRYANKDGNVFECTAPSDEAMTCK